MKLRQLKYEFIHTPLQGPLMWLRDLRHVFHRMRWPEQGPVLDEPRYTSRLLRGLIQSDWNCVDIGCHYGSVLAELCRYAPQGRHIAFEAIPEKVKFLRRKFPGVDIRELALCERSGETTFHINTRSSGFSGLHAHGGNPTEAIQVRCSTLGLELAKAAAVQFVKLDVEGAELDVLKGGHEFFSKHQPFLLFECTASGCECFGRTVTDVYDFLTEELHYCVFFIRGWLDKAEPLSRDAFAEACVYPFKAFNWFGVPQSRLTRG